MPTEKPLIICTECGKSKPKHARGMCSGCYVPLWKAGKLGPKPPYPIARAKAERVERACDYCGSPFSVKLSRLLIGKLRGQYCSLGCQRDSQKRPWGPSKPRPGIETWRRGVFTRDGHTCQACGAQDRPTQAHHIKPWAKYPDLRYVLSNGLTLCDACHFALHHPDLPNPYAA